MKNSSITPTDMLELPRPGEAIVNPTGSYAIISSSKFTFPNSTIKSLYLLDLKTEKKTEILKGLDRTEVAWIDEITFIYLRLPGVALSEGDDEVHSKDVKLAGEGIEIYAFNVEKLESYKVGVLPVEISNLKVGIVDSSSVNLVFSAVVYADGNIYTVADQKKQFEKEARGSDVRVYDELFARHWDTWSPIHGELTQLFILKLSKNPDNLSSTTINSTSEDSFELIDNEVWSIETEEETSTKSSKLESRIKITSPLAGTKLQCPVGPFGSSSDFDISNTHLVFHAKELHLSPAFHTKTQVWLVPLEPKSKEDGLKMITLGTQGACANPSFSTDFKRVAWLEMLEDGYEADLNHIRIYEINAHLWTLDSNVESKFDRSPNSFKWVGNDSILFTADNEGRVCLYQVEIPLPSGSKLSTYSMTKPNQLTKEGSITGFSMTEKDSILLTSSSLVSPNFYSTLSISSGKKKVIAKFTEDLVEQYGLDKGKTFTFKGADGVDVSGWILFPPAKEVIQEEKKVLYPLAFLVHGGPQGAWNDSWSTRWNPNMYTAQGYICVAINPTGSTGYGQKFCDDIKNNWGGTPFQDLVLGLQYVKDNYDIDEKRMAMLGASYGGYMANWIQGHNEITKFSAIVCHDGVFSTANTFYTTDEMYFPIREFGGEPWNNRDGYEKWSPSNHIKNWKTPELVIHSGKDFRLLEGEGLSVFNTLKRLGVPTRLVYFENENHWVLKPQNSLRWHEEVFKWINHWTA